MINGGWDLNVDRQRAVVESDLKGAIVTLHESYTHIQKLSTLHHCTPPYTSAHHRTPPCTNTPLMERDGATLTLFRAAADLDVSLMDSDDDESAMVESLEHCILEVSRNRDVTLAESAASGSLH